MSVVAESYENLRSFPGHKEVADNLYRSQLQSRARQASQRTEIDRLRTYAGRLPNGDAIAGELLAEYWQRAMRTAMRDEQRDDALLAAIESLVVGSPLQRRIAASLIGNDYPYLIGTVPVQSADRVIFDADNNLLSFVAGARVSQWTLANNQLQSRAEWTLTALDVAPLVRRLDFATPGSASRLTLTMQLDHPRVADLRVRLVAPSGRAAEIELARSTSSIAEPLVIESESLSSLFGETIAGTWSLSVRDESAAAPGMLVGWSLTINRQTVSDPAERPLEIPDPVARESDDVWFSADGRYAVARSRLSDSARLWDLLYAQPARTIAVPADERVVGLSSGAEFLLTQQQSSLNRWRTSNGRKADSIDVGDDNPEISLSADGRILIVLHRADVESELELFDVVGGNRMSRLTIAGSPAALAVSADGNIVAVADYDRAIRVWDVRAQTQIAQMDLHLQATAIRLSDDGAAVGVVHGDQGVSLWHTEQPQSALMQEYGNSVWNIAFSGSGSRAVAGSSDAGYQLYRTDTGAISGPALGSDSPADGERLLAFSNDESVLVTASASGVSRFWRAPTPIAVAQDGGPARQLWRRSTDAVSTISPGWTTIGNRRCGRSCAHPADARERGRICRDA